MRYELIEMPNGGVDQYTDAAHVVPGTMRDIRNVRMREPPKLSHRYGHTAYNLNKFGGGQVGTAIRMHAHKDSVLVADADTLYAWSPTSAKARDVGKLSECLVRRKGLHTNMTVDPSDPAVAYGSGYFVYAWSTASTFSSIHIAVVDEKNDTVVATQTLTSSAFQTPRLFVCGTTCWLLYADILGLDIKYATMDLAGATLQFSAPLDLPTTSAGDVGFSVSTFDACAISSTVFVVAYEDLSTGDVMVDTFSQTPAVVNTATINTASAPQAIAVEGVAAEGIFVAWADTVAGLSCTTYTSALVIDTTSVLSATCTSNSRAGIVRIDSTTRLVVWEEPLAGTVRPHMRWRTKTFAGGPGASTGIAYDIVPVSKPFTFATTSGTNQYVLAAFESTTQGTFFLVEVFRSGGIVGLGRWVATAARGIGKPTAYLGYVSSVVVSTVNTTRVYIPGAIRKRFLYYGADDDPIIISRCRIDAITFDFDEDKLHNMVSWGDGVFICGGRPGWYDGVRTTEHGFAWGPEFTNEGAANIGGSLTNPGTYALAVTYESEDANGYITRSAPHFSSLAISVAGDDAIAFLWTQDITLTSRAGASGADLSTFRAFIYRSLNNETDPLFRATSDANGVSTAYGTAPTITAADGTIDDFEVCYTSGGILDNAGTPPCEFACLHGERLWLGGMEDPEFVWFSQPFVEREQPRFNEGLRVFIGAPVVAMASMDAQLICWTADGIYAVAGAGPPATGGIDVGFEVRKISTDVGCVDWRSVVLSPIGLFFQSRKGVYLLDRGLNTTFIGAPVVDWLDNGGLGAPDEEIIAALAEEEQPTVQFLFNISGSASVKLVFDYQNKIWSADTFEHACVDMRMIWDGVQSKRVPALLSNATLRPESASIYTDTSDTLPVDTLVHYAPLKLNTIQGWQRVRCAKILWGETAPSVSIFVDFAFDYGSFTETHTFTIAETLAAGSQLEVHTTKQECQAIEMRIREANEGNAGVSYRSVVFEGGIMPGSKQLNAATQRK